VIYTLALESIGIISLEGVFVECIRIKDIVQSRGRYNGITIEIELRPCMVNGVKALFHKYIESDALVEYEDGTLDLINYKSIKFIDNKHKEYCWEEK